MTTNQGDSNGSGRIPGLLPDDLVAWADRHFSPGIATQALAMLAASSIHTGEFPSPQLLRCAALASRGQIDKLEYYIGLLRIDWRDVVVAGEYDSVNHHLTRVRNLSEPIPEVND